jgi:hypothetical protein
MEPNDCDARAEQDRPAKKPWIAPKVILSEAIARGVTVKNHGNYQVMDRHSSTTSTS